MKKFLFPFFIFFFVIFYGQNQIHIKYLYVRSPIANVYEDLYTDGKNVLSRQDGNIMFSDPNFDNKKKHESIYYISKLSKSDSKDFFFTEPIDNKGEYFVYDKIPNIEWSIDEKVTKKILGYNCTKASTTFRGSKITAFFAKEIPYSIGPFKFFGLPGAILDVRVNGKDYDLWKAVKIDLNNNTKVNYEPEFPNLKKMNMKDFVKLKDDTNSNHMKSVEVPGSTSKVISVRLETERIFEWEKETVNN